MKKLMLVLMAVAMGAAVANGTPPDKPAGGDDPPGGHSGGGTNPPAKPGEGDDTTVLKGAWQYTSVTNTLAGETLSSTTSDENVILAQTNAVVTVSNCVLTKSGDMSSEDNSNFFAVNAIVAAKTGARIYIDHSTLNSNATGANGLFASGSGSTIYAYACAITNASDSSRGLDATYKGTVIGSKLTIDTAGSHCAALATDRGNGYISVTDSKLSTAGQGSPLVYSTGVIEANGVTGTATGAQIAGIEGLSVIRIKNSNLSGSGEHASEPFANGVLIYQSNSGDSTDGTATFEVSDSTFTSAITNGAMFYITNSKAVITVQDTDLEFDSTTNVLIKAAGNDGEHGWGSVGSNGAEVVFTAIDQKLKGSISVDGISSVDLYLVNSSYAGTFVQDAANAGDGDVDLYIASNSTWTVTDGCTLKNLTVADGAKIVDGDGKIVSIVGTNGTRHVSGTSAFSLTVSDYVSGPFASTNITNFSIDRAAFEKVYGLSEGEEGESGGSSGTGSKTYYFKPHAPTNGVVGVSYNGTKIYPDMDHKYWLDDYWTNGVTVTVDFSSNTTTGYFFADGSSVTSLVLTITENRIDVYPPAGFETAYLAQAKSGSHYYMTLKDAIDAAGNRARVVLNDNVTLDETLTITNSITLDLATNTVTLGSVLTNAFHFTAGGTVSNGTIMSSFAADTEGGALMRFTGGKATLKDLVINGKSCLLYVDGAAVTLTNNCAFTCDSAHAAAIYCTGDGAVSIFGGTYTASTVLLSDDFGVFFKSDDVAIEAPDGYVWENGRLVAEASVGPVTPGVSVSYGDAQSATNAVAAINTNKAAYIVAPTNLAASLRSDYYDSVMATVTGDNCVLVDLTPEAAVVEQALVDAAVTNEAVVAALVSTNASETATLTATTPGLYYWIEGGTDVGAVTNAGTGVLSTDGGPVELSKPTLDAAQGRAFFRIAAGVSSPVQTSDE